MTAVMGLAQLLLDSTLNSQQRDYLEKLNRAAHALLGILNDILDYSKIEAGKVTLEIIEFDLNDLLESVTGLFALAMESKGLELIFDIDPSLPPRLQGDPLRLKQIINNLIGNAVKFTETGHIRLAMREAARLDNEIALTVSVTDTGIGMSAEQLSRLFQPFEQGDTSTTRKFGGTGLGLSISRHLIELMAGEITVESTLGSGSTFTFRVSLPLAASMPLRGQAPALRAMRTLIVEDQEAACKALRHVLLTWGFDEVDTALSADAGLEKVQQALTGVRPYELILVDWTLPGADGLELTRQFRQAHQRGDTGSTNAIVIMVTTLGRQEALQAVTDLHVDTILDKPVLCSRLFDLLTSLQGNARQTGDTSDVVSEVARSRDQVHRLHGARVLLVEDNPTNQIVASELLRNIGLHVTPANHGREALELVTNTPFQLVLMDVHMPEMNGIEATQRIRALPHGASVPIVAMTAAAMESDREACLAAGMNDFVAKPIDLNHLTDVLLRWIVGRDSDSRPSVPKAATQPPAATGTVKSAIDMEAALARLLGNRRLLQLAVDSFRSDFADSATRLEAHVVASRWADARRLAHSVKGAACTIGADALADIGAELEKRLAMQEPVILGPFGVALEDTLAAIARMAHQPTATVPSAADSPSAPDLGVALGELRTLLRHSRFVPPDLLEDLRSALDTDPTRTVYDRLRRHVENMDYPAALLALGELANFFQLTLEGGSRHD